MLKTISEERTYRNGLNRAKWHTPLISVVITHLNYADQVEDAILSVLDQTHENWECVIVDDVSEKQQRAELERIVARIGDTRIRIIYHEENRGQTPAFFTGLDATSGDFACLLDPDDRYAETFLEEALAAHLNSTVMCPIVSTEQYMIRGDRLLSGVYTNKPFAVASKSVKAVSITDNLLFFPPSMRGWHWASTSSMMFRRDALRLLKPNKQFDYMVSADSYMAQGCHMQGGSLFLTRPLIYRGVHNQNSYLCNHVVSSLRHESKYDGSQHSKKCLADAIEALKANGVDEAKLWDISNKSEIKKKRTTLQRWRRSFDKRWQKIRPAK